MAATLLSDLARGDPDRLPQEFSPPSAAFAAPSSIVASTGLAWAPGKMFLGVQDGVVQPGVNGNGRFVMGGQPLGIGDDRHLVTVAGTRAGKGRAVIIPNILHYPGSLLATDLKGELASITARQRHAGLGQKTLVLDPFGVTRGYPVTAGLLCGHNPIEQMRGDSLVEDASLIADALVLASGHADPHWDESARTFIEGVILHVKTAARYEGKRSLVTMQKLIAKGAKIECQARPSMAALCAEMLSNPSCDGVVQQAGADFSERAERERAAVLSTARRHVKFLNYPGIRKVVSANDFDLADLKKEPTTIFLCLPARHIGTCNRWLRLFVNLTMQVMERELAKPAGGHPVLFCLDEFASLGHMRQIEDAAGQIAGFGVKLWPILQDLGQLKTLYKDRWETFFGNAGVLQFFGNNDITTLEWIAKRCGETTIRTRADNSITFRDGRQGVEGGSWSNEKHDLVTLDEASKIFGRDDKHLRQLIIWAGRPPLILQRVYYDKHEMFRKAGRPLFDEV